MIDVDFDLGGVIAQARLLESSLTDPDRMPLLAAAFSRALTDYRATWVKLAAEDPGVPPPIRARYLEGIQLRQDEAFEGTIAQEDEGAAAFLRAGVPAGSFMGGAPFNLLVTERPGSSPIRTSAKGRKYRHIPVTSHHTRVDPVVQEAVRETGGGSLTREAVRSPAVSRAAARMLRAENWRRFRRGQPQMTKADMERRLVGLGKARTRGGARLQGYSAVRTISEGSAGWRHPGMAPRNYPEAVAADGELKARTEEQMMTAARLDMRELAEGYRMRQDRRARR